MDAIYPAAISTMTPPSKSLRSIHFAFGVAIFLPLLLFGAPALSQDDYPLRDAVECNPRDGVPNFSAKLLAKKHVKIAYLGGSIGSRHPSRSMAKFASGFVWILILCSSVAAGEPVDFGSEIAPIFQQHCVRCHSPGVEKGDFSLATSEDLDANEYVVASDADGSYLIELVTSQDGASPAMPKDAKPLSDGEVNLLRRWIEQGAKWPSDVVIREKSKADASWWSLQPLQAKGSRHTIDDFVRD